MIKNLTCITKLHEKLYSKDTGYILNYLTLAISEKKSQQSSHQNEMNKQIKYFGLQ